MNSQSTLILFLFTCIIYSCSTSVKVCENEFEKYEAKYYIQDNYKGDTMNYIDGYKTEDTIRHICYVNIHYPSICGLKNKIMEDSINHMLKKEFFDWADCCLDEHVWISERSLIDVGFKTKYVSNNLVSIILNMGTNCGAGGGSVIKVFNVDLKNGKLLEGEDIFKPMSQQKFEEEMLKIWNLCKQQDKYNKEWIGVNCDLYEFMYGSNFDITFTKETVIFTFRIHRLCNPCSIAIKKKEVRNIINSKYL